MKLCQWKVLMCLLLSGGSLLGESLSDVALDGPAGEAIKASLHDERAPGKGLSEVPPRNVVLGDPGAALELLHGDLLKGEMHRMLPICEVLEKAGDFDARGKPFQVIGLVVSGELDKAEKAGAMIGEDSGLALIARSLLAREKGDAEKAIEWATKAAKVGPGHPYAWNALGRAQFEDGRTEAAMASFQRSTQLGAQFVPGHANLAALMYLEGNFPQAVENYRKVIQLGVKTSEAYFDLGRALAASGTVDEAITITAQAVSENSRNSSASKLLTELLLRQGRGEEALRMAKHLDEIGLPDAWIYQVDANLQKGDVAAAEATLREAPGDAVEFQFLSGVTALASGKHDSAVIFFSKVLSEDPSHSGALFAKSVADLRSDGEAELSGASFNLEELRPAREFLRGCVLGSRGDSAGALSSFQKADQFIPGFSVAGLEANLLDRMIAKEDYPVMALGVFFYTRNLLPLAVREFEKGELDAPMLIFWRAMTKARMGESELARSMFEECASKVPTFYSAVYTAGEMAFRDGDLEKATEWFGQAKGIRVDASICLRLGLIYHNTGQAEKAEEQYLDAVKAAPDFFAVHNQLAYFYASRGEKLDEALRLARRADELLPGNASILDTLGWIHHLKGDDEKALAYLLKANQVDPAHAEIAYHLGKVLLSLGREDQGMAAIKAAVDAGVEFSDLEDAKGILKNAEKSESEKGPEENEDHEN